MSLFRRRSKPAPAPTPAEERDPVELVIAYHQRSKHDFQRFAPSLGFLDWANQPDPFRRYVGAPTRALSVEQAQSETSPRFDELFTPGRVAPRAVDADAISRFLFHSLGLSSAKRAGESHWFLRVNPSSGNLHPTEGWLILPAMAGEHATGGVRAAATAAAAAAAATTASAASPAALWHYAPHAHALEQRATLRAEWADALFASLPRGAFLVALSSIAWREAWKYGERAYRYVNHDVGHALGALRYGAALCGWTIERAPAVGSARLAELLGIDLDDESPEAEVPDLLAVVRAVDSSALAASWAPPSGEALSALQGAPNELSDEHHPWPILAAMEHWCRDPGTPWAPAGDTPTLSALVTQPAREALAHTVIRSRRSAVAMDRVTRLDAADFFRMLAATHPALAPAPFDALGAPPRVHLFLFVHRVDGLAPGLYLLPRDEAGGARLREAMHAQFDFATPEGCPPELPLLRLIADDTKTAAARVSCGQDIAADGAFSLGMLAEFEPSLRAQGPAAYPQLFWETGLIGQVLYLQAQAAGVSATGIGCFFDNPVHALAGLKDTRFQSLYHFTVGGATPDDRIVDEPAYAHLNANDAAS